MTHAAAQSGTARRLSSNFGALQSSKQATCTLCLVESLVCTSQAPRNITMATLCANPFARRQHARYTRLDRVTRSLGAASWSPLGRVRLEGPGASESSVCAPAPDALASPNAKPLLGCTRLTTGFCITLVRGGLFATLVVTLAARSCLLHDAQSHLPFIITHGSERFNTSTLIGPSPAPAPAATRACSALACQHVKRCGGGRLSLLCGCNHAAALQLALAAQRQMLPARARMAGDAPMLLQKLVGSLTPHWAHSLTQNCTRALSSMQVGALYSAALSGLRHSNTPFAYTSWCCEWSDGKSSAPHTYCRSSPNSISSCSSACPLLRCVFLCTWLIYFVRKTAPGLTLGTQW